MIRSHPFMLLVATLLLLLAGLAGVWLSILPSHLLSKAAREMANTSGLVLEGERPRLRFDDGLTLDVESVGIASRDSDALSATARSGRFSIGWSSLFGRTPQISTVALDAPVITLDLGKPLALGGMPESLTVQDGTLRLTDDRLRATISLAEVNGNWTRKDNGAALLQLNYLLDKSLMRLSLDLEDAGRLLSNGSPADITLTGKDVTASFSGRASLAKGLELDGQMNVDSASYVNLAQVFGIAFGAGHTPLPLSWKAGLSLSGLSATMNSVDGRIGPSAVKGQLKLSPGADRMVITGNLKADTVSVWAPESPLAKAWSEAPLPVFDVLAVDSDLTLDADRLVLRGQDMGSASLALAGKDGAARLTLSTDQFAGGAFSAGLDVTPEGLSGEVKAKAVEAQSALAGLVGIDWLSGPLDMTVTFKGTGRTVDNLIGTATGNVSLVSSRLDVRGLDLAVLKQAGAPWSWSPDNAAEKLKLALQGKMQDGIIVLSDSEISGDGFAGKPVGDIDLLRQHLSIGFAPKAKGISDGVVLQGPWMTPDLGIGTAPALRQSKDTGKPAKAEAPHAN